MFNETPCMFIGFETSLHLWKVWHLCNLETKNIMSSCSTEWIQFVEGLCTTLSKTHIYINQKLIQVSNLNAIFSGANVLQVLPLAHEYQSPLVTKCENFMIAMCRPLTGLTVSTLLDYILAGDKYSLTRFPKAAVEFCAKIDFDFLTGKKISKIFECIPML